MGVAEERVYGDQHSETLGFCGVRVRYVYVHGLCAASALAAGGVSSHTVARIAHRHAREMGRVEVEKSVYGYGDQQSETLGFCGVQVRFVHGSCAASALAVYLATVARIATHEREGTRSRETCVRGDQHSETLGFCGVQVWFVRGLCAASALAAHLATVARIATHERREWK